MEKVTQTVSMKAVLQDHQLNRNYVRKLCTTDSRFDLKNKMIIADALVTLNVKNTYDLSGKLLTIPVSSTGDSNIHLKNTLLHIRFWYEHVEGPDGKIHWNIYKHDIKYEVEKASFRLDNLMNDKNIADFIHPCNETSRECLIKATQDAIPGFVKGMPHLGVEVLDPFIIDRLSIPLNGLTFTFYNGKVTGFRNCIVDDVVSELEKRHFVLAFHCNLTIKGTYDAKGQILLFTIDGAGDAKVKLTNLRMKVDIKTKYIKDKEGANHFALKSYKYSFDYGDRVHFDLENLFKESKELSATVLTFLNENWKLVAEEFGKPIVDYAVDLAIRTIEKFFIAVPYEELINVPIPKF